MKRILFLTLVVLQGMWLAVSCTKDHPGSGDEGQVMLTFKLAGARTRTAAPADFDDCNIRLYKYNQSDTRELIRQYFDFNDIPEQLWLLAGKYMITVSLGDNAAREPADCASFDLTDCLFYGESGDFTVAAGQTTPVEVVCNLLNTIIEVEYDSTIPATFDRSFRTIVGISDEFDLSEIESGAVPGLTYSDYPEYPGSRRGYFRLPEGADKFSFCFWGQGTNEMVSDKDGDCEVGEIHEHFTRSIDPDKREGYRYLLYFSYTPDAGGHLQWDLKVELVEPDEYEDKVGISPGKKSMVRSLEWSSAQWNASARFSAIVYEKQAEKVEILYRPRNETEWTAVTARKAEAQAQAAAADYDLYTAEVSGLDANTKYECVVRVDGKESAKQTELQVAIPETVQPETLPQIPNAGFETWTGTSPLLPYKGSDDQFWDTGNHGSSTLGKNVTSNTSDAHGGSYSAKLESQFVGVAGIGKFAAGNIFVGQYLGTNGTNGVIGFGKPFPFTLRPKRISFWYKGTVGKINNGSGAPGVSSGDSDVAQFYALLCSNMKGPHVVDTRYTGTFLNFDAIREDNLIDWCSAPNGNNSANDRTDGHVVAYAIWENQTSMNGWTKITLEFTYTQYTNEVPEYLMITASASKYGDYFMGSTNSVMYIDDVEIEY